MDVQHEHLHGLVDAEARAESALVRAVAIVKREAAEVQPRESVLLGLQSESVLAAVQQVAAEDRAELRAPSPLLDDEGYESEVAVEVAIQYTQMHRDKLRAQKDQGVAIIAGAGVAVRSPSLDEASEVSTDEESVFAPIDGEVVEEEDEELSVRTADTPDPLADSHKYTRDMKTRLRGVVPGRESGEEDTERTGLDSQG